MNLSTLSDAQLTTRLDRLVEERDPSDPKHARDHMHNLEWEVRTEIAGRAEERQLRVLFGEFSSLVRTDLSFADRRGDEWATVHEAVILVDDNEADDITLMQCVKADWDYCTETGGSFFWTPLMHGPLREVSL